MLEIFAYRRVTDVYFTDQNRISKTVYCIRCAMVYKIGFTDSNSKIALLRASMVVTYYIKLLPTRVDRHNGILMSLSSCRDNYSNFQYSFCNQPALFAELEKANKLLHHISIMLVQLGIQTCTINLKANYKQYKTNVLGSVFNQTAEVTLG